MTDASPNVSANPLGTASLLHAALDAMSGLSIVVFDADLRFAAVHGGAVREHGYDPALLIGQLAAEVLPAPAWERLAPLLARTLAGESFATEAESLDGSAIYASTFEPVIVSGAVVGGLMRSVDITALQRERRGHSQTLQQFQAILDHSPFAIDLRDLDGRFILANREYHAIVGAEPGAMLGKRPSDLLPEPVADGFRQLDQRVIVSGSAIERTADVPDVREDEPRRRSAVRFPVLDDDGNPIGVGGISTDVTDRERQARELHAARELLEAAFENAPVGKIITRIDGPGRSSVIKCNPAFAQMLGATTDDVLGRVGPSLIHPEDTARHRALLAEADEHGTATGELRLRHRAGHGIWTQIAVSRVRSAAGDELRFVQAVDITARKEAEEHLRYIADHDALTGIRGRRCFEQELSRATRRVRSGEHAALLLIDLNGFKAVNDTLGHSAGDDILTRVAAALQDAVRPTDMVARLGGDEFAVLLPQTGQTGAERVAKKLARAIARHGTTTSGGKTGSVTGAIGIATLTPEDALTPEEALRRADADMYRAKAEGRGLADPERIAAVHATGLLDLPTDPELQRVTDTVADALGVPIALISLLTADQQHFIAQTGLPPELAARGCQDAGVSYCQYPTARRRPLIVPDTRADPLLAEHVATTQMGLGAYAGLPLQLGGHTIGVICVADTEARPWTEQDLAALRLAAAHTTRYLREAFPQADAPRIARRAHPG